MFASCQLPWSPGDRSCADHARLDPPVDLSAFAAKGTLWPFGVHGGPHPEGHPGIDFILDGADAAGEIEVKAPFSAEILSVTPETGYPGNSCLVMDSACIEVNLCHLHLDTGLAPGVKVRRGQRLGAVGLLRPQGVMNSTSGPIPAGKPISSAPLNSSILTACDAAWERPRAKARPRTAETRPIP